MKSASRLFVLQCARFASKGFDGPTNATRADKSSDGARVFRAWVQCTNDVSQAAISNLVLI
jgi:hypothetical protein